jgi:hypothetical protein
MVKFSEPEIDMVHANVVMRLKSYSKTAPAIIETRFLRDDGMW